MFVNMFATCSLHVRMDTRRRAAHPKRERKKPSRRRCRCKRTCNEHLNEHVEIVLGMFEGCFKDVASGMFQGCFRDVFRMFSGCVWDVSDVSGMFYGCLAVHVGKPFVFVV